MSVPVLKALSEQYPETEIYLLTGKLFNPLFSDINNLNILNPDLKGKHKGIKGLFILFTEIKKNVSPDIVIDIHDVLRTKILRLLFKFSGIKVRKIDKGRRAKRKLTKQKNKVLKPLKHTTERYTETFFKAGLDLNLKYSFKKNIKSDNIHISDLVNSDKKNIGIAPFAKHLQKQYPIEKTEELIKLLSENNYQILLFGGGNKEKETANKIAEKYKNTINIIGKYSLKDEIALMNNLDVMITPDSGNMHLAALTSVKIISIWGATHPFAGFTPFVEDNRHLIIRNSNLKCSPCSIFGNKKCYKHTLECLYSIPPEEIFTLCKKITD